MSYPFCLLSLHALSGVVSKPSSRESDSPVLFLVREPGGQESSKSDGKAPET